LALGTLVLVSHADDVNAEVNAAALAAHVDPVDLQGALNSQGQQGLTTDPYVYLRANGALPTQPVASPPAQASGVWQQLAQCESHGSWSIHTGNGYSGGLQEDATFWRNYGGLAFAPAPYLATPAQQILVAERGLAAQGFAAWPACSRALGLR